MSSAQARGWGPGWPNCSSSHIVDTHPLPGIVLPVRREIAPLVTWLCRETERRGYHLVPGWCWGYACRPIRGTNVASNHSWGLAVDLNAPTNPRRSPLRTNMPGWMVDLWTTHGFGWGGYYSTTPDSMHYEFVGTPADAARIIATLTHTPAPVPAPIRRFLPMLSDAEQEELLAKVRGTYATVRGSHPTPEHDEGDARGTPLGRILADAKDQTGFLRRIVAKLGA